MKYSFDFCYQSLNKNGEELCGDKVEIVKDDKGILAVLSDGLGSGVKANILATLTSKIIATMISGGASIDECIDTITSTLPVCSERGIAYSTFIILKIDNDGNAYLVQYDCPASIVVKDGAVEEQPKKWRKVFEKEIFECEFKLGENDMVVMFSDGVINAGVGQLLNLGWTRKEVVDYVQEKYNPKMTAADMTSELLGACDNLYMQKPGDDTTVVTVKVIKHMPVCVMVGPPVNAEEDDKVVSKLLSCTGKKVVCGGTTSQIVAKKLGKPVEVDLKYFNAAVPPIGKIEGIDLVTEGVITLGKACEIIQEYAAQKGISKNVDLTKKDGATLLAKMLIKDSTEITFLVGRALNPAHQNPDLPLSLGLKLRLIEDIAEALEKIGKKVTIVKN